MTTNRQRSGDESVNIQANNVHLHGITYGDAKEIARQIFFENVIRLSQLAEDVARSRAEEITNEYLRKLQESNIDPSVITDTDLQYSLFIAQRDYARSGKEDLKRTLVDLLIQRSSTDGELEKVVLTEAIETTRKLTSRQIAALTTIWQIRNSKPVAINFYMDFVDHAARYYKPFVSNLPINDAEYAHLQYTGCASTGIHTSLGAILFDQNPGLFQRGFPQNAIPDNIWTSPHKDRYIVKYTEGPAPWKTTVANDEQAMLLAQTLGENVAGELISLMRNYRLMDHEIIDALSREEGGGFWQDFAASWADTRISGMHLSSVGIAIAHSNFAAVTGDTSPLSTWISESAR